MLLVSIKDQMWEGNRVKLLERERGNSTTPGIRCMVMQLNSETSPRALGTVVFFLLYLLSKSLKKTDQS